MTKYNFELDFKKENSLSIIIGFIKKGSKILEFGPANGRLTKYLKNEMNCEIDIVEIDETSGKEASLYARKSLIGEKFGNIDNELWVDELENEKYDYIIFADVLEHLKNPVRILSLAKEFLKLNGSICFSIPNLAHNSVIIDLFNNKFNYTEIGLLDKTHISFFTYESIKKMVEKNDLTITEERVVYGKVGDIEIQNYYDEVPYEVAEALKERDYAEVYQYVFKLNKKNPLIQNKIIVDKKILPTLESKIYIIENIDEDFLENKILKSTYDYNTYSFNFDFMGYANIKLLRWDPLEQPCIVEIEEMLVETLDGEMCNIEYSPLNSIYQIQQKIYFGSKDPQLILDMDSRDIKKLQIKCKFETNIMKLKEDIEKEYLNLNLKWNNNKEENIKLHNENNTLIELIKESEIFNLNLLEEKINLENINVELFKEKKEIESKCKDVEDKYNKTLKKKLIKTIESIKNKLK